MPSRNLFILAAAMQLPLALWLHGCKDDKDDDDNSNNQDNQSDNTDSTTPPNSEQQPTESKMHSKFFLEGQYKELIKDLVAQKGKDVEFKVRKGIWDQNADKVTATALAAYINESTEGMVSLHGSAFNYEQLRNEWRAEYVADMWESDMQLPVSPGTVSTNALQWYMNGKTNQVMFSDFRYNNGGNVAQTKVVDAHGIFEQINQNMNQQMVAPKRNLIVTELYHGGYDNVATPPKNNPHNFAVTFFQVSQDMDVFWEVCVRAFHQVLSINQMLAMTVRDEDSKNWPSVVKKENGEILTAWEVIEEKESGKWVLNTQLGSRKPDVGVFSQRHEEYLHELQKDLKKYRDEVWTGVRKYFSEDWKQKPDQHYDLAIPEDFAAMLNIAIADTHDYTEIFKFKNTADGEILGEGGFQADEGTMKKSSSDNEWQNLQDKVLFLELIVESEYVSPLAISLNNFKETANKLWKNSEEYQKTEKFNLRGWKFQTHAANDYTDDYQQFLEWAYGPLVEGPATDTVVNDMPKFLWDLLIANKPVVPEKAGLLAFENFRRECRRDQKHNYIMPSRKELLALPDYKIEVLEVIHPGSTVDIVFAETMLAAFYQTFRSLKKATYLQHPSNHQVIMGDASSIVGHNGYNPYQQPNPVLRQLNYVPDMMIKVLRFVTIESMTEGEAAVECFETVVDRLDTVEVKVTIKEHKEVSKLKPGKKNTIGEHIRAMQ